MIFFKWREGACYSKARGIDYFSKISEKLIIFTCFFSFLLVFGSWAFSGFKNSFMLIFFTSSFLSVVIYYSFKFAVQSSRVIIISNSGFKFDKYSIKYNEILSVRIGISRYNGESFPVMSLITKDFHEHVIGLSDNADSSKIKLHLESFNIEVLE